MQAARKDPSAEHLHEWRKRVKDLWHVAPSLQPAAPKRMNRLSRRAHTLADRHARDDLVDHAKGRRLLGTHRLRRSRRCRRGARPARSS